MKKVIYSIVILIFVLFMMIAVRFLSKQEHDSSVLRVATSYDYPPYTFVQNGMIVGFDIDLIKIVADKINKKVEIAGMPFSALIFSLFADDVDVIASAMSPTPRRKKFVLFSDSYLQADPLVIVSKNNKNYQISDLALASVVVNTGFVADTYMSNQVVGNLVRLATPASALLALDSGSVDVWVTAQSSARAMLSRMKDAQRFTISSIDGTSDDYAFVVNPHNHELLHEINGTLSELKNDGTITMLQSRWGIA